MKIKEIQFRENYGVKSVVIPDKHNTLSTKDLHDVDVILERKNNNINFIHITFKENTESILLNGFKEGVGNLGKGVYAVNLDEDESLRSIRYFCRTDLVADIEDEDEVTIIFGQYDGFYTKCIKALNIHHEYMIGFYLLENSSHISNLKHFTLKKSNLESYLLKLEKQALPSI